MRGGTHKGSATGRLTFVPLKSVLANALRLPQFLSSELHAPDFVDAADGLAQGQLRRIFRVGVD